MFFMRNISLAKVSTIALIAMTSAAFPDDLKVVTAPGATPLASPRAEAAAVTKKAPTERLVPPEKQTDEPVIEEELPTRKVSPAAKLSVISKEDGKICRHNDLTLPCSQLQTVIIAPGTARQIDFGTEFSDIQVADPAVIDVRALTHQKFIIIPQRQVQKIEKDGITYTNNTILKFGNSDVYVYDEQHNRIGVINVIIDAFSYDTVPNIKDSHADSSPSVVIYSGKNLREPSYYRCDPYIAGGCSYVGQ